jgi:thioredoxin reductase
VAVIGAGAAGTGAALAAARAGAAVTVVDGGSGASTLGSGALDLEPWERARETAELEAPVRDLLAELDAFSLEGALVATMSGVVRPAAGADRALLDLARLEPGTVAVPRSDHAGWDAHAFARAWSASARARARGLAFVPVDAQITRLADERAIPDADIAARHDDEERVAWLAERLKESLARAALSGLRAVILPPWLGVERARAGALSTAVGVACGEAIGSPGGPAGLRFERARDRALSAKGVSVVRARVTSVARSNAGWNVRFEEGSPLAADAVVLAIGGLVGGGLSYDPSSAVLAGPLPPRPRPTFSLTVGAPVEIGLRGAALTIPGSLHGEPPESLAWPFVHDAPMDRAGVLVDAAGRARGQSDLFAAGECAADLPRTWLASFASGARAGAAAT